MERSMFLRHHILDSNHGGFRRIMTCVIDQSASSADPFETCTYSSRDLSHIQKQADRSW